MGRLCGLFALACSLCASSGCIFGEGGDGGHDGGPGIINYHVTKNVDHPDDTYYDEFGGVDAIPMEYRDPRAGVHMYSEDTYSPHGSFGQREMDGGWWNGHSNWWSTF